MQSNTSPPLDDQKEIDPSKPMSGTLVSGPDHNGCYGEPLSATEVAIRETKMLRKGLDQQLDHLKRAMSPFRRDTPHHRTSRERSIVVTKIQEAIMWLGMDLKAINEETPGAAPDPYPQSYNPDSPVIEPTADGLKL